MKESKRSELLEAYTAGRLTERASRKLLRAAREDTELLQVLVDLAPVRIALAETVRSVEHPAPRFGFLRWAAIAAAASLVAVAVYILPLRPGWQPQFAVMLKPQTPLYSGEEEALAPIPKSASLVLLHLPMPEAPVPGSSYGAIIMAENERRWFERSGLTPVEGKEGRYLSFAVPREFIRPGIYLVRWGAAEGPGQGYPTARKIRVPN